MNIETKFDIGQDVWYIHGGKARHSKVSYLEILYRNNRDMLIKYTLEKFEKLGVIPKMSEDRLFSTKEELIASL